MIETPAEEHRYTKTVELLFEFFLPSMIHPRLPGQYRLAIVRIHVPRNLFPTNASVYRCPHVRFCASRVIYLHFFFNLYTRNALQCRGRLKETNEFVQLTIMQYLSRLAT